MSLGVKTDALSTYELVAAERKCVVVIDGALQVEPLVGVVFDLIDNGEAGVEAAIGRQNVFDIKGQQSNIDFGQ